MDPNNPQGTVTPPTSAQPQTPSAPAPGAQPAVVLPPQPIATPPAPGASVPAAQTPPAAPGVAPQVAPAQPYPAPTPYAPYTAAPGTSTTSALKRHKTWLIPAAVLLVFILLGTLLSPLLLGATQADYKKATAVLEEAHTAYSKTSSTYVDISGTETEIKNDSERIKTSYETFSNKFTELGKLKAIKRDAEVGKLYKAAKAKKVKSDIAMEATLETYDKILPTVAGSLTSSSQTVDRLAKTRIALESISGLKDPDNKIFVEKFAAKLKDVEGLYARVQAGYDDYKKYDSTAFTAYSQALTELSDITRDWKSSLEQKSDAGDISKEMNALGSELIRKSFKK